MRVHPRVRGEYAMKRSSLGLDLGSSPRPRGRQVFLSLAEEQSGSITATAGEPVPTA